MKFALPFQNKFLVVVCSVISSVGYPVCKPFEHAPSFPKPSSSASTDSCCLFISEHFAIHPSIWVFLINTSDLPCQKKMVTYICSTDLPFSFWTFCNETHPRVGRSPHLIYRLNKKDKDHASAARGWGTTCKHMLLCASDIYAQSKTCALLWWDWLL